MARVALQVDQEHQACSMRLVKTLTIPLYAPELQNVDFILQCTHQGLALKKLNSKAKPLRVDFLDVKMLRRLHSLHKDPIARAIGIKRGEPLKLIDATAGLGQDAFSLAALGCEVLLVERSPIVAALLEDGLERARKHTEVKAILARMRLRQGEAKVVLKDLAMHERPDVIYLDPMYPQMKKSPAKRKAMEFFRTLLGDDLDAEEILIQALEVAKRRVVVKRPLKAPSLGKVNVSASIIGKTTRFDFYLS